jgi:hypothetical protein
LTSPKNPPLFFDVLFASIRPPLDSWLRSSLKRRRLNLKQKLKAVHHIMVSRE